MTAIRMRWTEALLVYSCPKIGCASQEIVWALNLQPLKRRGVPWRESEQIGLELQFCVLEKLKSAKDGRVVCAIGLKCLLMRKGIDTMRMAINDIWWTPANAESILGNSRKRNGKVVGDEVVRADYSLAERLIT